MEFSLGISLFLILIFLVVPLFITQLSISLFDIKVKQVGFKHISREMLFFSIPLFFSAFIIFFIAEIQFHKFYFEWEKVVELIIYNNLKPNELDKIIINRPMGYYFAFIFIHILLSILYSSFIKHKINKVQVKGDFSFIKKSSWTIRFMKCIGIWDELNQRVSTPIHQIKNIASISLDVKSEVVYIGVIDQFVDSGPMKGIVIKNPEVKIWKTKANLFIKKYKWEYSNEAGDYMFLALEDIKSIYIRNEIKDELKNKFGTGTSADRDQLIQKSTEIWV